MFIVNTMLLTSPIQLLSYSKQYNNKFDAFNDEIAKTPPFSLKSTEEG